MSRFATTAGKFELEVFTDGYPLNFHLYADGQEICRANREGLHDLRYCIDRVLAQVEEAERAGRR